MKTNQTWWHIVMKTAGRLLLVTVPALAALVLSSCGGFIATEVEFEVKPQTNNTLLVREWWRDLRFSTNEIRQWKYERSATQDVIVAHQRGAINDIIGMVHAVTNRSEDRRSHADDDWTVAKRELVNCGGVLNAFSEYHVTYKAALACMTGFGAGVTGNCFFFNWSTDACWQIEHNGTVHASHDEKFQVRWPTNATRLWLKLKMPRPIGLPLGKLYEVYRTNNFNWGTNPVEYIRWR